MNNRLNKYKYPGAKRLMLEAQEMKDKTEDYCAQPIDDNLFEWHFTVRGPPETAFEGGYYHGRLSFPTEYPMKPPSIILLTPNGRFETNMKICLSISGHHPESWQPSWSVRTALLALVAFMPTKALRAIGSLDFTDAERKKLARNSRTWRCETCGPIKDLLLKQPESVCNTSDTCEASTSRVECAKEIIQSDSERLDRKRLANGECSDSDGEARDSSTDSSSSVATKSTTSSSDSDESSLPAIGPRELKGTSSDPNGVKGEECKKDMESTSSASITPTSATSQEPRLAHGPDSVAVEQQQQQSSKATSGQTVTADESRSYPLLVFVSISLILFLLILRRVFMWIQA